MRSIRLFTLMSMVCVSTPLLAQQGFERDTIETSGGHLIVSFIGHGTLMFQYGGKTIHVDPFGRLADYAKLPRADILLITHQHGDHLDIDALEKVRTDSTVLLLPDVCATQVKGGTVMKNGDHKSVAGIEVEAVPAYNLVHMREGGVAFHPKGEGNGYVLTFGRKRIYVAGDTENTPEMKSLKNIDVAFLPMNLPYTMTPEMVADAARGFKPRILYPYHYGKTDPQQLIDLLKSVKGIAIRVRKMQ